MNFVPLTLIDLLPASAEIFVLVMACVLLIVDLFVKSKARTGTYVLTLVTLVLGWFVVVENILISGGEIYYTFSNLYVSDLLGSILKLVMFPAIFVVLVYGRGYVLDRPQMARGEFYILTLFATLGMMVMISANHFLTIYLGLELLSLSLYALVALNRDSVAATEAAMKYFVLGALASGLLLYGMSMIYGATGSLEITRVAVTLSMNGANKTILIFGLVFLIAGLAFKLGVVPFHMWIPDVYHGAPTAVTLFIGSAPKLAAFAIAIRMLVNGLLPLAQEWQQMLMIMAVLSMAVGNLAAIAQTNIKRMLAYSAISHMGFMLLGLVSGVVAGDPGYALSAYSSSMFYVLSYVIMSVGTFGTVLLLSRAGYEAENLEDFKGLNKRNPWFAGVMLMFMFSMAGIPFFVGFFAKFTILLAVLAAGYNWLAIAAIFFSLVGAFYYLRVVKVMYFDAPVDETPVQAPASLRYLLSANGIAVALFGIFPQALLFFCALAIQRSL